jgi:hypothetical protein
MSPLTAQRTANFAEKPDPGPQIPNQLNWPSDTKPSVPSNSREKLKSWEGAKGSSFIPQVRNYFFGNPKSQGGHEFMEQLYRRFN